MILIGVASAAVLVAAVVFVVKSDGDNVATDGRSSPSPTTTMRPCVQPPPGATTTAIPATPTTTAPPPATPVDSAPTTSSSDPASPPDGTYLGTVSPSGTAVVTMTVLTEGGASYTDVPLAAGLTTPTGPVGGAVTVDGGTITAIDTGRVSWDDDLGRGADPCEPRTGCVLNDEPVPHAWPGGVDGVLGDDIRTVPERLSVFLAKWGIDVDPLAITLVARPCILGATIDEVQVRMAVELTDDGYVLADVTSDPAGDPATALSYTAQDEMISIPLPASYRERYPEATVSASIRFGDRAVNASVPAASESLDVAIDRRMNQRGAIVLIYRDDAGSLLRLVASQIPAGNSSSG